MKDDRILIFTALSVLAICATVVVVTYFLRSQAANALKVQKLQWNRSAYYCLERFQFFRSQTSTTDIDSLERHAGELFLRTTIPSFSSSAKMKSEWSQVGDVWWKQNSASDTNEVVAFILPALDDPGTIWALDQDGHIGAIRCTVVDDVEHLQVYNYEYNIDLRIAYPKK
jgi:hypothetical protein